MKSGNILQQIAEQRKKRIDSEGHALGVNIPEKRIAPLVPFLPDPPLICEIKRGSPSKGIISGGLDPVEQAGRYIDAGVRSISVLTEEDHFHGSLNDLMQIKAAYPQAAILRKEFILDEEDLEISYRAGADAVLLIAALLDAITLEKLYGRCKELGLQPLVEVHTREDVEKAERFKPELTGINCRDLTTFKTDLLLPLGIAGMIRWKTRLVFESGISFGEDIRLVLSSGFSGALIGETVVRYPERLDELVSAADAESSDLAFWRRLVEKRSGHPGRPLVKICGITCAEDALYAESLGADILGFVFAESPRRASIELLRGLKDIKALKVAVVVTDEQGGSFPEEVKSLLGDGLLDAVQFHGDELPDACSRLAFPYYKAVRAGTEADLEEAGKFRSPRVLLDARVPGVRGGSGQQVDRQLARKASETKPLWLAGGIDAENAAEIVKDLHPELIDLSSGVEKSPGKKDHHKLKSLFEALDNQ